MAIVLQEVHGDDVTASLQSAGILQSHVLVTSHPFSSHGFSRRDSGGVGLLLSKGYFVKGDDGSLFPFASLSPHSSQTFLVISVRGRAISFQLWDCMGIKYVTLHNVHNYELSAQVMTTLGSRIRTDIRVVERDLTNSSLILLGDFNIPPPYWGIIDCITNWP